MRIGLQTWGSTGDVRPFLALAAGLAAAGHAVHLCVSDIENGNYDALAAAAGFRLTRLATPPIADRAALDRIGERVVRARNPFRQARIIFDQLFAPCLPAMHAAALDLCAESDVVVRHHLLHCTQAAAEVAGITDVSVLLAHNLVPTRHIRPADFPPLGPHGYAFAWWLARRLVNRLLLADVNALRSGHRLARHRDVIDDVWLSRHLNLLAVSPLLLEAPEDWPGNLATCGFLALASQQAPLAPALAAFLASGEPPIFVTVGSMLPKTATNRHTLYQTVVAAVLACGSRAIVQVHPDDLAMLAPTAGVHFTSGVEHAAVFPHVALVVHHGGAGTTHTVLRAGVPSVVVAYVADQFFWGDELTRLGVAPRRLLARSLTARGLAQRLRHVLTRPALRANAAALAVRLRDEDGVGQAVRLIEDAHSGHCAAPLTALRPASL